MFRFKIRLSNHLAIVGAVALSVSLFSSSCDDILTEEPTNFYDADTYFTSPSRVEKALLAVYSTFSELDTYGQYVMVYDCDTDIAHVKGADKGHVARDLGHYFAGPTNAWLEATWKCYYEGIDRANTILENYNKVEVKNEGEQSLLNLYIAETKFLRGLIYFDLVRYWGDVPLKLNQSKSEDNFAIPRENQEVVYDQIIKDMTEAIPFLPWHTDSKLFNGRLSRSAGFGLLARVYLYRGGYSLRQDGLRSRPEQYKAYYQKVVQYTDSVILSGKHSLVVKDEALGRSGYEMLFRNYCENKIDLTENIYEIDFFNPIGDNKNSGNWGTYNGPEISEKSIYGRANSFIKTLGMFYDKFETGDLRRDVAIATFSIDAKNVVKPITRKKSQNWSPGKWRRNWQTGPIKNVNNTDVNLALLRYADVLLMNAEAQNEVNESPNALAIEYANQVRRRAFGKNPLVADATIDLKLGDFNKDSFIQYLQIERARELCFEGFRKADLIRWNILEETIVATNAKLKEEIANGTQENFTWAAGAAYDSKEGFQANRNELFPIPQRERIETEGVITQNPGYSL